MSTSLSPLLASILLKNTGSPAGRFDYSIPADLPQTIEPGDLVEIPFRDKPVNGIAWETRPDDDTRRVKPVSSIIRKGILQAFQLPLAQWVSDYYYAPLAKVVEGMVPEKLWNGSFDPAKHRSQTISLGNALPRGKRQTEAWQAVKDVGSITFDALKETVPWIGKAFLNRMLDAGILTSVAGVLPAPYFKASTADPNVQSFPLTPTPSQKAALQTILFNGPVKPYLLFGPPASGKTEVYLEIAKRKINDGKQALILVPEIALTTQLIAYFVAAFGTRIAVLHSQLNDTERCIEWERLRTGEAQVAIGSRIALFAPFRDLGCICVDEEHEWTYKSEQTPRYHARDVAIKLAELTKSPIILGSATPSIESFTYAKLGKYGLLRVDRV